MNKTDCCISSNRIKFKPSHLSRIKELTEVFENDDFELVKLFFNLSPEMFCVLSRDFRFIKTNKSWQSILGWSTQDLTDKSVLDFIHKDDIECIKNAFNSYDVDPVTVILRCKIKKDGYKNLEWNILFWKDERFYAVVREASSKCVKCASK